jgi:prevent-host-death family protein
MSKTVAYDDHMAILQDLSVSEFKAHCLAVIERVASTGQAVQLTRHGKPVARLVAVTDMPGLSPQASLRGTVEAIDDLIAPVMEPEAFSALRTSARRKRSAQ